MIGWSGRSHNQSSQLRSLVPDLDPGLELTSQFFHVFSCDMYNLCITRQVVRFLQDKKKTFPLRSAANATRTAQRDKNPIAQVSLRVILPLPASEGSKAERWFLHCLLSDPSWKIKYQTSQLLCPCISNSYVLISQGYW